MLLPALHLEPNYELFQHFHQKETIFKQETSVQLYYLHVNSDA